MQIQSTPYISQYNSYKVPFKSWEREVFKTTTNAAIKELKHRNDTLIYRGGSDWYWIVNKLLEKYKNTLKVNVYNYGCSNGSEPYTFLMELLTICPKKLIDKFTPIIAKDYDPVAINVAKSNRLPISELEQTEVHKYTGKPFSTFFREVTELTDIEQYYAARTILTDKVHFRVADILEDYKNIQPDNSVVFARNFWPYLSDENQEKLAQNLYNQLGKNSTLFIGEFDLLNLQSRNRIPILLWNAGFHTEGKEFMFVKS